MHVASPHSPLTLPRWIIAVSSGLNEWMDRSPRTKGLVEGRKRWEWSALGEMQTLFRFVVQLFLVQCFSTLRFVQMHWRQELGSWWNYPQLLRRLRSIAY